MPSDEQVQSVLGALSRQREAFRSALVGTVEQVRSYLSTHATQNGGRARHTSAELGSFAEGRIDFDRFATVTEDGQMVDPMTVETMQHALNTLGDLAALEERLFVAEVEPGHDLRETVRQALEEIGRAFGAARVFELSRTGRYRYSTHARSLGSFPFARWNRTERRMAPPLVVHVDGADLHAGGLAEFLDGGLKLVLVVRGATSPAPLARLVMPDTFVIQCRDAADLTRFGEWQGAGIAAIVPESAAEFVHDPEAGGELWRRLTITRVPEAGPRMALGGLSVAQQTQELTHLRDLAAKPPGHGERSAAAASSAGAAPGPGAPADPVDKLATWLLNQADLTNVD